MNVERPVLRSQRYKINVERPVLRSGRRKMNVERPVLRLWSVLRSECPKINVERPVLRSGRPKRERESRLHRFRPASPQQTLGSQGVVAFAVAVVAFAEGPRARPSPRSITYVMRGNLCLAHRPAPRRTPAEPSSSHGRGRRVGEEARTAPPPAPARFFLSSGKA